MSTENRQRLTRQRLGLGILAGAGILVVGVWIFASDAQQSNLDRAESLKKRRAMTDLIHSPDLDRGFLSETGVRLKALEQAVSDLEKRERSQNAAIEEKEKQVIALRQELDRTKKESLGIIETMAGRVASVEAAKSPQPQLSQPKRNSIVSPPAEALSRVPPTVRDPFVRSSAAPRKPPYGGAASSDTVLPVTQARKIEVISFNAAEETQYKTKVLQPAVYNLDDGDYVPPNSYARAKVLVGVDMTAGVRQGSDPKPVLFRIIGPAVTIKEKDVPLKVSLEGCLVNGAAYAELSSERVFVKLQKITCDRGNNEVAESPVEGYIAQLGKVGVRGRVVSREGDIIGKAFLAGTIGSAGRGLQRNTDQIFSSGSALASGGATTIIGNERLSPGQVAAGSLGEGVATAASTVSEYLIERAEQYQPVIEMPTGIEVDLVFQSGFMARGKRP